MTQTSTTQTLTKADILTKINELAAQLADLTTALDAAPEDGGTAPINHQRAAELGMTPELADRLDNYLAALNQAAILHFQNHGYRWEPPVYRAQPNPNGRFLRVIKDDRGSLSVHAFIEKATGKVVKAAGWAAPAKSMAAATKGQLLSKYTLGDEQSFQSLLGVLAGDASQIHGSYLYGATA